MLEQSKIYEGFQIDTDFAVLLENFHGLELPFSPQCFLEDCEFYVAPRYLSSSLTKQDLDNLYNEAQLHFSQKEYVKAGKLFEEICHYNHLDERGWEGLGDYYTHIQKFDQDPLPIFYSIECYIALKMYSEANLALEVINPLIKDKLEFAHFQSFSTRIKQTLQHLPNLSELHSR